VVTPTRPALRRLAFLDAIRGLAALAVFVQHAGEMISPAFSHWCHDYFDVGNFGVAAFFLVSGMIIPASFDRYQSVARFWRGRFWRLYPLYWVNLFIVLALGYAGVTYLPPLFFTRPWLTSLANATMLHEFLGLPNANGAYWTLTVEMVFYVLCSLLFLTRWLSRPILVCLVMAVGLFAINVIADVAFHRSIPTGHASMIVTAFFGTVVYRHMEGRISRAQMLSVLAIVAIVIAHGMWERFTVHATPVQQKVGNLAAMLNSWTLAYVMFFAFFALRGRHLPSPLIGLGKITYSLYLMHGLVIQLVPKFHPDLLWVAVAGVVSIAVSSVTYTWIERPVMRRAETGWAGRPQVV
jgi:peptidoglycan/LPS O-acetylase OafA/YrhL